MNLHEDNESFNQYLIATADFMGLSDAGIIEKDYYLTLLLKRIVDKQPNIIFKGGTSLLKCYRAINRFSEDLDLNAYTGTAKPTESQRKKLKEDIISVIDGLGFSLVNPEHIRGRKDFNRYVVDYMSESDMPLLGRYLIVETEVFIKSFPIESMNASCLIYDFLSAHNADSEISGYGLEPFSLRVQSIKRTFIDKVFAIGDYYLSGQAVNHSRHIYDLHKIYPLIEFDGEFKSLVSAVRELRKTRKTCLCAKDGVCMQELLTKIIDEEFFVADYTQVTDKLLFENIPYTFAIDALRRIIESRCFDSNQI